MTLKNLFVIARAWSLTISFSSVSIGTALAWQEGSISWLLYFFCLTGAFCLHAGANMLNDYFDFCNKVDSPESPTALYRPHPVFAHLATPKKLLQMGLTALGIAAAIGLALVLFKTPGLLPLLALGFAIAVGYTGARKMGLKYMALGEIAVFLAFGPLMMEGTFLIQRSNLSLKTFLVSLPVGLWVALILLANNLRDTDFDRSKNITTLCTCMEKFQALRLLKILTFSCLGLTVLCCLFGILDWNALVTLLVLPLAIKTLSEFSQHIPAYADTKISKIAFLYSLLLILSLVSHKF
ncbi:MAG: prenyltransferase [Candidatus Omnitrophota bacterium]